MTTENDGVDLGASSYALPLPYNGTEKQGANPLEFDVNLWYQVCARPHFPSGMPSLLALRISDQPHDSARKNYALQHPS